MLTDALHWGEEARLGHAIWFEALHDTTRLRGQHHPTWPSVDSTPTWHRGGIELIPRGLGLFR